MKILLLADTEERALWDFWSEKTAERLSDVSLILSAGDLKAEYLEFIVTMTNLPLVYVRGNHDGEYDKRPPEGCIDADGRIVEVTCRTPEGSERIRILGLGGSMRYKPHGADMYTEKEMKRRILRAYTAAVRDRASGRISGPASFDILLTHAPCRGWGDMDDLPHTGFDCFNALLERNRPKFQCYGHVHREYGNFRRIIDHPSGTPLINASGYYIYDM